MSTPSTSQEVIVPLPEQAKAPGYRDSFTNLAGMRVRELAPDWLAIAPREGAGSVYDYFHLERLCDAANPPSDETWSPLLAHPPVHAAAELWPEPEAGKPDWRERLRTAGENMYDPARPETQLASMSAILMTLSLEEVPAFLSQHARAIVDTYQAASFWFMRTDELLVKRSAMLRALLTIALAPDVIDENDPAQKGTLPPLKTLQEHSLTRGSNFAELLDPLLLTFSPGALGYVFKWTPHALVFLSGINASLVRAYPQTPSALYLPHLQNFGLFTWKDSDWFEDVEAANAEALLQWWVTRLNVVYSHLLDPTNFDALGRHDAPRQVATLLTFERLLADLLLVQTGFQGAELARQQAAFDLLDKAEALLGFGKDGSGQGFERLLRRASMVTRLDEVWQRLPLQLQSRFRNHTRALYDGMYEHVRQHAYGHRTTAGAIKVGPPGGPLKGLSLESYVPQLVRAVRNSAHGFIEVLTSDTRAMRHDRELLATHDGKLPPHFPDRAALIGFALVADFERVAERGWLPTL
jgi:hypothetical protein